MIFTGKFFVTKTTRILNTFVLRLNMFLEMTFPCKLFITLITRILDTFMFRMNMFLKTTYSYSLIITQITRILDTTMVSVRFSVKDIQMFLMIVLLFEIFSTWSSGCGYKETLPPHELIWYVYLNDDLDVFLTPVIFIILKWRWQNSRLQDGWMDADRALFWKSHLNDLFFVTKTKDT